MIFVQAGLELFCELNQNLSLSCFHFGGGDSIRNNPALTSLALDNANLRARIITRLLPEGGRGLVAK